MEYVRDDEKAAREGIKNCYLGQLTQMWVGGVRWSKTFINHCFYGIFGLFLLKISGKFTLNVPNFLGWVGWFTSSGQCTQIKTFFLQILHRILKISLSERFNPFQSILISEKKILPFAVLLVSAMYAAVAAVFYFQ